MHTAVGTTPALSISSTSTSPTLASPALSATEDIVRAEPTPDFVARVAQMPIVHSALRAYEHGKARSRVVKVRVLSTDRLACG